MNEVLGSENGVFAASLNRLRQEGAMAELRQHTLFEQAGRCDDTISLPGMQPRLRQTREALLDVLSCVPGVEVTGDTRLVLGTDGMTNGSSRDVRGYLDMSQDLSAHIAVQVVFPDQHWPYAVVSFERVHRDQRIAAALRLDLTGNIVAGEINNGKISGTQCYASGIVTFRDDGRIETIRGGAMDQLVGVERINVARIVRAITTSESLDQPFDASEVLARELIAA